VDADRLLEARLVLELDDDVVAGFQHLRGGLGEARLVAVQRRHGEQAGQARDQGHQRGEQGAAPTPAPVIQARFKRHEAPFSTILSCGDFSAIRGR
jgi:hypothetical protein